MLNHCIRDDILTYIVPKYLETLVKVPITCHVKLVDGQWSGSEIKHQRKLLTGNYRINKYHEET